MPDNNRKVLSDSVIAKLNSIYKFTYDKENNKIVTNLSTCKRVTMHDTDKPFVVLSKWLGRKITFSIADIEMFCEFQNSKKLAIYSLFEIHNTVNKLKAMYQQPTSKNVADLLQRQHTSIKRI